MLSYIMNMMKYLFIVVIYISLINGVPAPLGVQTRMRISGSLGHLCENNSNGSDELPSCECLEQFAVQGNFLIGDFQKTIDTNLLSEVNSGDVVERLYSTNKTLDETVLTKVSGLECIDKSGSKTELNTIYSYFIYYYTSIAISSNPKLLTLSERPPGNPSSVSYGIIYVNDMNENNSAVITNVIISINDTDVTKFENLGKICRNDNPPRSLETFLWSIVNKVYLNSSKNCDVPKDSFYPIHFKWFPTGFASNELLKCGDYKARMYVKPVDIRFETMFYVKWSLPYNYYCANLD